MGVLRKRTKAKAAATAGAVWGVNHLIEHPEKVTEATDKIASRVGRYSGFVLTTGKVVRAGFQALHDERHKARPEGSQHG